ncbi:helix-turn-helix domain-containing protein [Streptomyces sp. NPDC059092]|uniref:helix-turn-helix domain-containing protein n=1 Tax=Streptomyces sp. NPDC059092 TaxID=3346725 RepID=UPI0036A76FEA
MKHNLLVIGATGQTGGDTAELLLQRGHRVRALVRRVDERSERLAGLGAQTVEGDVLHLGSLAEATKGIDALYFTYPILPGLMDATANVALASEENGVQAIVNMSQVSARRDFTRARDVGHYARALGYSPRTLTRAAVAAAGVGAKEFIDRRVVLEGKRLLAHGDEPVAGIGARLGFLDTSNFVKYFVQRTGTTPTTFRSRYRPARAAR